MYSLAAREVLRRRRLGAPWPPGPGTCGGSATAAVYLARVCAPPPRTASRASNLAPRTELRGVLGGACGRHVEVVSEKAGRTCSARGGEPQPDFEG